jgi:hypothetical protein
MKNLIADQDAALALIAEIPYRINPLLAPRTLVLFDKGMPSAFVIADNLETIKEAARLIAAITPRPSSPQ